MGFEYEEDDVIASFGHHGDFDGVMVEVSCLCPLYGKTGSMPVAFRNGMPHQVFRSKAAVFNSGLRTYGSGNDLANVRRKVVTEMFRNVQAARSFSDFAVGPITDMKMHDGNKVVVIPDHQAAIAYQQTVGM